MEQILYDQTITNGNGPVYPHQTITHIVPFTFAGTRPDMPTHEGEVHIEGDTYIVYKYPDDAVWFVVIRKEDR